MFNETPPGGADHAQMLGILARARSETLKRHAETLLADMGEITVVANRTGLVMVPMRDTVGQVDFHLGEVLVSEAQIADRAGHIGYGMVTGRDLERAMAMAVIDLSVTVRGTDAATARFLAEEKAYTAQADETRMRQVEATRVEMETF
ncbi:phosphonate C-P lyase system protein PhnG [uncultured Devosia sp.]|uniref:phosphonate C-P lyase system protein PhnG n=1 Tax=uncultured Devosia sp. TaxID=211434 RepID=UPI002614838E|nr:phosphonate C-P lyase system protein PhnG [uncultured Devosia sp.]